MQKNLRTKKTEQIVDRETMRILRDVNHQSALEARRLRRAKFWFVFLSSLVAIILGVDYLMARTMFDYMDPTLGGISLGPTILALSVPIAVIAVHLLIADDGGQTFEYRLRRLAGVGVMVFLFGMASMISLVFLDASDGLGSQGQTPAIEGTIGTNSISNNQGGTSWLSSAFSSVFSGIPPIIFFLGMTLILFVTIYVVHRLISKIESHYEFFINATRRSKELKQLFAEVEELIIEIKTLDTDLNALKKQLPRDLDTRFSQIASAAIYSALHVMKKALNGLTETNVVLKMVFEQKASIPAHIKTWENGLQIITEIQHATSPYAILNNLGSTPPKEEV